VGLRFRVLSQPNTLKAWRPPADIRGMLKLFGTISVVASLAVAGVLWSQQAKTVQHEAPNATLGAATTVLEVNHRIRGTYAGTTFSGVEIVRADATSYCVEAAGYFVAGPGGKPTRGGC
jgi:hypothetical protein